MIANKYDKIKILALSVKDFINHENKIYRYEEQYQYLKLQIIN